MTRQVDAMLSLRGQRYGPFARQAELAQLVRRCLREHDTGAGWARMSAAQKEAAERIVGKLAGIVNGDPDHVQSWAAIAGYAQRAIEDIEATGRKA